MDPLERLAARLADPLSRRRLAVALGAVAVAALAVVVVSRPSAPPPPEVRIPLAEPAAVPSPPPTPRSEVVVHVAGAVARPGLYVLAQPARVADAIDAAGGVVADTDLTRVNLAGLLGDGERLWIPATGEEAVPLPVAGDGGGASGGTGGGSQAGALVDVNSADAATLETLPGVGPATAAAIISHRDQHGPFRAVDDLIAVSGIGPAKLAAIRDLVVTP